MELRIGVQHSPREITVESEKSAEDLTALIETAVAESSLLRLEDPKGRVVLVPGAKIAYVDLSTEEPRRVGFLS
ncbi:DUF3107 domain-containing protein [Helcobacillus massiliensis]|uniref:DUF3107 family protein n=1 Tax=Helcobacillus massiliensis TaxID=521392 RepID=A0A839QSZ4_9MICO|nr:MULTISPECIES: DUF3107 domain-containing protein [Helcobacillus]MBB3022768.1 hypothetical protein [Helcobacillus massiliensis]MCG7427546.1 DUF3107 domain-containing protein [Helcobacillus sp. ACRRO]MCT1558227.1 DUF3107 domain-containing protein [Helcobacillus massiliensis]MCT2036418.1 DUF3107 domain-containing protein [Helcobacillus massiliensis]MCT2332222.1 DUF3107 domain-containing protein [Helcobacillus massiliensis]